MGVVSLFIWKKPHKIKQIDCIINEKKSLLSISETIKDKLEIRMFGKPTKAAYLISLDVINSGTEAVFNQPVMIHLSEGARIVDYSIKTEPNKGFGRIQQKHYDNCLDLTIDLMNKGDVVKIEILSIDNPSDDVQVFLKNANVRTRSYTRQSANKIFQSVLNSANTGLVRQEHRIPKDRDFRPGEFEELYKQLPTFMYYFERGFTPIDVVIMDRVVQAINEHYTAFDVTLKNFEVTGTPHATFTVLHKDHVEEARKAVATGYETQLKVLEGQKEQLMDVIKCSALVL